MNVGMIIVALIVLIGIMFGLRKGFKKSNEALKGKEDKIEEEFKEGKIIMPLDQRDFQDLNGFRKATEHVPEIQDKLDNLNRDRRDWDVQAGGKKDGQQVQ